VQEGNSEGNTMGFGFKMAKYASLHLMISVLSNLTL